MTAKPNRYIYVRTTRTIHDSRTATERCNLDDVKPADRKRLTALEAARRRMMA